MRALYLALVDLDFVNVWSAYFEEKKSSLMSRFYEKCGSQKYLDVLATLDVRDLFHLYRQFHRDQNVIACTQYNDIPAQRCKRACLNCGHIHYVPCYFELLFHQKVFRSTKMLLIVPSKLEPKMYPQRNRHIHLFTK